MPLRVGIVGYGGFGRFLHASWSRMQEVEVVAVADSNPEVDVGLLDHFRDWGELVREPSLDVVSIATPPNTHAEIACAAMEAGRHVLIEKPLAATREDAVRLIETRDRTGRRASINHMLRFNPIVEVLVDWSRRQPFGPLQRVLVENYAQDESLPREHWFWDGSVSGGILVEHAVHFIDVVQACVGPTAARVDGLSVTRDDGRSDRVMMSAVYSGNSIMTQYHAFSRPGFFEDTSMRFVFDVAQVDVHGWIPLTGRVSALVSKETESEIARLPSLSEVRRTRAVEARGKSRPQASARESHASRDEVAIRSSGREYDVNARIDADFDIGMPKSDAYSAALVALMRDLVRGIRDPEHRLRVTLEDGLAGLETALRASGR